MSTAVETSQQLSTTTHGGVISRQSSRFILLVGSACLSLVEYSSFIANSICVVVDVAVGARKDDDGGSDRGAVWILFLNADGTVKSHQKISSTDGGFTEWASHSSGAAQIGSSLSHRSQLNDPVTRTGIRISRTTPRIGSVSKHVTR